MPPGFQDILGRNVEHLLLIMPELVVAVGFVLALLFDLYVDERRRRSTGYVCLLVLLAALVAAMNASNAFMEAAKPTAMSLFCGMVVSDGFGAFFKILLLLGTIISMIIGLHARELSGKHQGEFFLLLTATCLGGMFLVSSTHLLMIYLSLEALSLISYALAGFLRRDRKSAEAGIKYVIYGAMASGIMIFGMSYLYGLTGSMDLDVIVNGKPGEVKGIAGLYAYSGLSRGGQGAILAVLAMVFCGLLYKIAAAPFHYWSPDVYEGAPTTATAFFSVVPKAAGFAIIVRVLAEFFPTSQLQMLDRESMNTLSLVVAGIAVLTMTIGNLAALGQNNAKRMMAYSSIAHAGYMLAGLTVLNAYSGAAPVLYYLVVYLVMNLGAFLILVALENIRGSCELRDLRGAIREQPLLSCTLVLFLFSLIGLPPLAGFMGKYLIMAELANMSVELSRMAAPASGGHWVGWFLILFMGLNSVISLYYYMRLAKAVVIDVREESPEEAPAPTATVYKVLASLQAVALLLLFVYSEKVVAVCQKALQPLGS